jgi:hypothetical protein
MTVPMSVGLIVAVVAAGLIPSTVAADRPTEEELSPVGDQFVCDGTLVTVQSGPILEREHVHALGSGLSHVIVIETPNDVTLMDEEGTAYRLVGDGARELHNRGRPGC